MILPKKTNPKGNELKLHHCKEKYFGNYNSTLSALPTKCLSKYYPLPSILAENLFLGMRNISPKMALLFIAYLLTTTDFGKDRPTSRCQTICWMSAFLLFSEIT